MTSCPPIWQARSRAIEAAGFEFFDEVAVPAFKENYLLRFRRPTGSAAE
jgi:hypothetical protein